MSKRDGAKAKRGEGSRARRRRRPSGVTTTLGSSAPRRPMEARRIEAEELSWRCPPLSEVELTEAPAEAASPREQRRQRRSLRHPLGSRELVGQQRAADGLRFAFSTDGPARHIVVSGPAGSGRRTLVEACFREARSPLPEARDRVLVHDFQRRKPRLLTLPRGAGRGFLKDVDEAIGQLRRRLAVAFEAEDWHRRRERHHKRLDQREKEALGAVLDEAAARGFTVNRPTDGELLFVVDGRRWTRARLEAALERGAVKMTHRRRRFAQHQALSEELAAAQRQLRRLQRGAAGRLRELEEELIGRVAEPILAELRAAAPTEGVRRWLEGWPRGVAEQLAGFLDDEEEERLAWFRGNLLVDASAGPARPFVHESDPSLKSLFGSVDGERPDAPEFLRVKAGRLLEADGGALVLDAGELSAEGTTWKALRRCLNGGRLPLALDTGVGDVPLAVTLVLVGDDEELHELLSGDALAALFGLRVEMETTVSVGLIAEVAAGLRRAVAASGLRPLEGPAMTRLLEYSARRAQRQGALSLRFGPLLELAREADWQARERGAEAVAQADLEAALEARRVRRSLQERQTQALLSSGVMLVATRGERIGQVNALVVYENGEHSFARPCRVTATVAVGSSGIIDIERESALSGEAHHKGVQIISGLLRDRYGQDKPLALTAGVCFEQSYTPIDGDSASAAEVIAILSALARAPVKQSIAVTGSVNQLGDLQAVGGVNEKIEGFYDACLHAGLTGEQGVLIPESTVAELSLREDVAAAVEAGRFGVYAASTVDAALSCLTGLAAGAREAGGGFPAESLHGRADARLAGFAEALRRFRVGL